MHLTQLTAGNGITTTQAFSSLTGLIQTQTAGPGNAVANFTYAFDTIGNLTARTDGREGFTESFCYDALNRLTNYATNAPCLSGTSVTYDSTGIGNITSKSDIGTYGYPASGPESVLPHAVSAITGTVDGLTNPQYSYDGNGNLTCISTGASCTGTIGKQISLTSFNMAASISQGTTTVSLSYDSEHKRLTQTSTVSGTTTTTTYINDPVSGTMSERVQVSGDSVPVWIDYLTVDGNIVAQRQSAYAAASAWGFPKWGQFNWGPAAAAYWAGFNWGAGSWSGSAPSISYFVLDHLGSVAVVTDQNGNVTSRLSYDPWGKRRNPNGSPAACGTLGSSTTRGFTNQEELDQVCFVNLNARIYDPSIGKFMSADPVVGNIYVPNAFNRYAYVLNNPLSFTDTSGYGPEQVIVSALLPTANPIVVAAVVVIDVIATILGIFGAGGGHAVAAAALASHLATASVSGVNTTNAGVIDAQNPSGVPQLTNSPNVNISLDNATQSSVVAQSSATSTDAFGYAGGDITPPVNVGIGPSGCADCLGNTDTFFDPINGDRATVTANGILDRTAANAATDADFFRLLKIPELAVELAAGGVAIDAAKGALTAARVGPQLIGSFAVPQGLKFKTTTFGNYAHRAVADLLQELHPNVAFQFRILPGQTGVDVTVPEEFTDEVGYQLGEIKPLTPSGEARFLQQVNNWDIGPVQPITYDALGNVYYGFH